MLIYKEQINKVACFALFNGDTALRVATLLGSKDEEARHMGYMIDSHTASYTAAYMGHSI